MLQSERPLRLREVARPSMQIKRFYGRKRMHYLSVYCRFRNEAVWLREWLEYYRLLGVDHFFMIDHLSTDNPRSVLDPYINHGLVTYVRWDQELEKPHSRTFVKMGNHALRLARGKTRWLAIFDSDEFLMPVEDIDLKKFLVQYERHAAVVVNWAMFGTAGVEKIPPDQLMLEALTKRAPRDYHQNHHIKTILQPALTKSVGIHDAVYYGPGHAVNTNRESCIGSFNRPVLTDKLRLHHYFLRDREFVRNTKIARRQAFGHNPDVMWQWDIEMNAEDDESMARYTPALRNRVIPPDWQQYLACNPDLLTAGINTEVAAHEHWFKHGLFEGRNRA